MSDPVNHPDYYGDGTYEAIRVMEAIDPEGAIWFCRFSALKYLFRAGKKEGNPEEHDFDKAADYCTRAGEIRRRLDASGEVGGQPSSRSNEFQIGGMEAAQLPVCIDAVEVA